MAGSDHSQLHRAALQATKIYPTKNGINQFVLWDYYMYVCTHHIGEIVFKKFWVSYARINFY